MKTRNAVVTLTICVLLALTTTFFINLHKVSAQPKTDCRKIAVGTYFATNFIESRSFLTIITFTQDGNYFATASSQSGVPSVQPFSNVQGSWKCTSDREITVTGLSFNYPTATLPGSITRSDFRATFDPETETVRSTPILSTFELNANPLEDDALVTRTFTFTGQRVKPGQ